MSLGLRLAKRAQGRRAPHLVHARYHLTLHLRDAPRDARVRERALARGTLGLPSHVLLRRVQLVRGEGRGVST